MCINSCIILTLLNVQFSSWGCICISLVQVKPKFQVLTKLASVLRSFCSQIIFFFLSHDPKPGMFYKFGAVKMRTIKFFPETFQALVLLVKFIFLKENCKARVLLLIFLNN